MFSGTFDVGFSSSPATVAATAPGRRAQAGADAAHRGVDCAAPAGSARQRGEGSVGQAARDCARVGHGCRPGRRLCRPRARAQAGTPRPLAATCAGQCGAGAAAVRQAAVVRLRRHTRGSDAGLEQRLGRGTGQPAQDPQAPDAWPRQPRPARTPLPARSMITKTGQDPVLWRDPLWGGRIGPRSVLERPSASERINTKPHLRY